MKIDKDDQHLWAQKRYYSKRYLQHNQQHVKVSKWIRESALLSITKEWEEPRGARGDVWGFVIQNLFTGNINYFICTLGKKKMNERKCI